VKTLLEPYFSDKNKLQTIKIVRKQL
jgi:hypothetical protein